MATWKLADVVERLEAAHGPPSAPPASDRSYRGARIALEPELARSRRGRDAEFDWRIAAHQLLRRHGQTICRNRAPRCSECPLRSGCRHGRAIG